MKAEKKVEKTIMTDKFLQILSEETEFLKQQIAEEIKNLGDPIDVKMNPNGNKTGDSNKALVYKDKSGAKEKSGGPVTKGENPIDVDMNEQPSKGGSDEKAATAVEVKAGAEKGGNDVTTGQAKAKFTSKTSGPKDSVSDPFTKTASKGMNKEDKVVDKGTKTYVEAGGEKGGTDVTAGQHKTDWKEKAPKSDNDERISKGIQLKEKYTRAELNQLIETEAKKLANKMIMNKKIQQVKQDIVSL